MKNSLRKLLFVLYLVAVIGVSAFAQSKIVAEPACAGEDIEFTVNIDPNANGNPQLQWDFGDGNTDNQSNSTPVKTVLNTHAYDVGNTYTVTVTISYTGGTTPDETVNKQIKVYKRPPASFYFGEVEAACAGEAVTLSVNTYGNNVLWSTGDSKTEITVRKEGKYKAVVYSDNMCTAPEGIDPNNPLGEVEVVFFAHPEFTHSPADVEYDRTADDAGLGERIELTQNTEIDNSTVEYTWNPSASVRKESDGVFYVNPENSLTYTVTAERTHNGLDQGPLVCSAEHQVKVDVVVINGNESTPFTSNNVFMPGSVRNNVWMMNGDNELKWYEDCKLIIYNVWGQEVFVEDRIGNLRGFPDYIWDGTSNDGDELPADTYYYLVQCSNCNCEPNPQKNEHTGTVTIMRK